MLPCEGTPEYSLPKSKLQTSPPEPRATATDLYLDLAD
jgi:hypothetical protein